MKNIIAAHIHIGSPSEEGPVVATLFQTEVPIDCRTGMLADDAVTTDELQGPLQGKSLHALVQAIQNNNAYVQVHTTEHPGGEIRGPIQSPSR